MIPPEIQAQAEWIGALESRLPAPVTRVETHISWVLLAGEFAYKIKKAVNFGFLDFSTLERRRFYCHEELRLNRRLAPRLYLDVVSITGSAAAPVLDGAGEAIEYAVKMRRFPAAAQGDVLLAQGALQPAHIDALARTVAAFHRTTPVAVADSIHGDASAILEPVRQNFAQIRARLDQPADLERLQAVQTWSEREFQRLIPVFTQRKAQGFVRECHGDLHLGNLALFEGEMTPFDCIEFNENLRWIDVMSEVAFLAMDLHDRRRPDFSWRFLNAYLTQTGDYAGLDVLRFYQVYRALVRAKVACLGCATPIVCAAALSGCRDYLALAETFAHSAPPLLLITHGLSGSGKSTLSGALAETAGAIHIRSDVERKRLFGMEADAPSHSALDGGLYTAEAHQLTYRRLAELARGGIAAGYSVMVDAAFLRRAERDTFRQLAETLRVAFVLLDLQAPPEILRARIQQRWETGRDASEATLAVLERQQISEEPLDENEKDRAICLDGRSFSVEQVMQAAERLRK